MNQNDASSSSSLLSKKIMYRKRKKTLKKKAKELSILCGVPVGLVCIEHDGKLDTWPENLEEVDGILQQYLAKANNPPLRNPNPNPNGEVIKKRKSGYQSWHPDLDYLPEENLVEILEYVKEQERVLEERIVREKNKEVELGLGMQICDDSDGSEDVEELYGSDSDSG